MKALYLLLAMLICGSPIACSSNEGRVNEQDIQNADSMKLKISVGTKVFTATLYNNPTAKAFKSMLPMTVNMIELNGNEKYVDLSGKLPTNATKPASIHSGDLMIYGSNTLVLFYKTFSTSYSYTSIGKIDDPSGLAAAVGSGNVTVTFELE